MIFTFTVEGLPSTDHRARSSSRIVRGKVVTRHHKSPEFAAWKARMADAALRARPAGWRLDLRYAVECIGYMPSQRYDADNLRGLPDACQGILWANDNRVRPVTYDYDVDKNRPRLEVTVAAFDPRTELARRWLEIVPKIDITIDNRPCTATPDRAGLSVQSRPRADGKQRPRGAPTPGARPNLARRLDVKKRSTGALFDEQPDPAPSITMRARCPGCGHPDGRIITKNGQDTVRCAACDRFCYCAPKVETGREVRSVTTVHNGIKPKQRARLLMRASGRCELCGGRDNLHVGHALSVAEGLAQGFTEADLNDDENLIAQCAECNLGLGKEPIPVRVLVSILRARLAWARRNERDREAAK